MVSTIQGLRTQETKKFENFFAVVQEAAKAKGCIFFFDTGDGRDIETEAFEGEDLMGWLVPEDKAKAFEKEWKTWKISSTWDKYFAFAIWNTPENLSITFKK